MISRGPEMRLQIGLTLATVFLALFTVAMWREKLDRDREGRNEDRRKRFGDRACDGEANAR
jgi:Tfp pilus assembly protein PilX